MEVKTFSSERLGEISSAVWASLGVRADVAREVTHCLIETSLRGIDSHGIRLLPHYVRAVRAGRINPNPQQRYEQTSPTTGILDANDSFGHWAASLAMKYCITMARESGCGFVSVRHSTHFSACAYYSLQAAKEDMIGIATTNTSPIMVPTRGSQPTLGTNPISFGFPCEGEDPVCIDMATTQVTWNHVLSAKQEGRKIEPNLAVNSKMQSTENPEEAVALFPMGQHKGYCLALIVDILCSILGDAPFGPQITEMFKDLSQKRNLAHFVGAIHVGKFLSVDRFKRRMAELASALRNMPPQNSDTPVLVPGDPEKKAMEKRLKNGIPLSVEVVASINQVIEEQNLSRLLLLC